MNKLASKTTVLTNGLKIISTNPPCHSASLGIFINAGSRSDITNGTANLISKMAFSSTILYQSSELKNELELIGGNVHCQSTLESINYSASLFKHDISKSISLFSQIINEPLFLPQEVEESKKTIDYENQSMRDTPEQRQEAFIHLAYSGKSLGVDTRITDNLTKESLDFFKNTHYTPNNMCIAGVGVDHDYLVDKINDSFGGMTRQALNIDSDMKTVYTGGLEIIDTTLEKVKNPDDQKLTHVYIGFEGLSMTDPDIYSLAVLASLFGGGGSFSAGGPGKGMYTRLYKNILNQHYWVESSNHFNHTFRDSGLFGIYCSVLPSKETHQAVAHVMCEQLIKSTVKIGKEELSRAKNMLKSMILMGGESQGVKVQDIGRQYSMFGGVVSEETSCDRIDSVTAEDVMRVARRIILGSDEPSRFKYDDGIMSHFKRTGKKESTILIEGPVGTKDVLHKIGDVLTQWGIQKPPMKKLGFFGMY